MVSEDIEAQTMISSVEDTPKAVKVRFFLSKCDSSLLILVDFALRNSLYVVH